MNDKNDEPTDPLKTAEDALNRKIARAKSATKAALSLTLKHGMFAAAMLTLLFTALIYLEVSPSSFFDFAFGITARLLFYAIAVTLIARGVLALQKGERIEAALFLLYGASIGKITAVISLWLAFYTSNVGFKLLDMTYASVAFSAYELLFLFVLFLSASGVFSLACEAHSLIADCLTVHSIRMENIDEFANTLAAHQNENAGFLRGILTNLQANQETLRTRIANQEKLVGELADSLENLKKDGNP